MESKFLVEFYLDQNNRVISLNKCNERKNDVNIFYKEIDQHEFNYYGFNYKKLKVENNEIIENKIIIDIDTKQKQNLKINLQLQISEIKIKLNDTDYKIIKCYESFMLQQPLPYNLEELSAQRDGWRAEINQIEEELKTL
jgi:hypothetical protein